MVSKVTEVIDFDIQEKSISELQQELENGETTSVELVKKYLERIELYDQNGPEINSIISINPKAYEEAASLDQERIEKGPRGALHGIPILVKDNFDTFDMPTTAASVLLKDSIPSQDATMVKQLRDAGAIIIAKANMHEFAYGISTASSLGGQTFNPYKLNHHPGGSSGGTGAAIASNFAAIGLGTDTGCSIRNPSSYNNLVGLRSSYGLTSRAGIIPISFTQDVGGPMGRSVKDVAIVMDYIAGQYDERDKITRLGKNKRPESYVKSLTSEALKGAKIGVLKAYFGTGELTLPTTEIVTAALTEMQVAGAELIDIEIDVLNEIDTLDLWSMEFKKAIADYLETLPNSSIKNIDDIIESHVFTPDILERLLDAQSLTTEDELYQIKLQKRAEFQDILSNVFKDYKLDAIAYPTFRSPPPMIGRQYWDFNNGALSAVTGYPAISIPAGFTSNGLPVGIELLGEMYDESKLLQLAYSFEQRKNLRKPPVF